MEIPFQQRIFWRISWILIAIVAIGALLDAVSDANNSLDTRAKQRLC